MATWRMTPPANATMSFADTSHRSALGAQQERAAIPAPRATKPTGNAAAAAVSRPDAPDGARNAYAQHPQHKSPGAARSARRDGPGDRRSASSTRSTIPPAGSAKIGLSMASDPVIEAYKKDIDRTLLRENLKLTPEQRVLKLMELQRFAEELRRAGKGARRRA